MGNFFLKPKLFSGHNSLDDILKDIQRVLIVTEKFMLESGKIDYLVTPMKSKGIDYQIFSEVKPDPDINTVAKGVACVATFKPQMIIALGGGSSIDCAKGMKYFSIEQGHIDECIFTAIPTTSGTGSEVTKFMVLSHPERRAKYPIVSEMIVPDIALLDAELIKTVPAVLTAYTGMDALTHAIEAYVATEANDFTDANAEKALRLIDDNLVKVYRTPDDMDGRQRMHNAACLAGIAFSNAGLGINHSMAHTLGGHFHIQHGLCNAILLPIVIEYNAGERPSVTSATKRYAELAHLFGKSTLDEWQGVHNLIQWVKITRDKMKIAHGFCELGIEWSEYEAAIPEMIDAVLKDGCTTTNPRIPQRGELYNLFYRAYYGK